MMAWYVLGHTKGAPRLILGSLAHVITWQCWRLVSLLSHSLRVFVLHTSCFLRQSIPAVKACLQKTSCSSSTKVAELCMLEYACWQHPGRLRAGGLMTCPSECCTTFLKSCFLPMLCIEFGQTSGRRTCWPRVACDQLSWVIRLAAAWQHRSPSTYLLSSSCFNLLSSSCFNLLSSSCFRW